MDDLEKMAQYISCHIDAGLHAKKIVVFGNYFIIGSLDKLDAQLWMNPS